MRFDGQFAGGIQPRQHAAVGLVERLQRRGPVDGVGQRDHEPIGPHLRPGQRNDGHVHAEQSRENEERRVSTNDNIALAHGKRAEATQFYAAAFGLKETNRLQTQGGPELFLNFGDTVDAARANSAAAAKAAGGTVEREATQFGTTGIYIAFVVDPESNHIELIQQPAG